MEDNAQNSGCLHEGCTAVLANPDDDMVTVAVNVKLASSILCY